MDTDLINYIFQNSFAIAVALYLLYERAALNKELTLNMNRLVILMDLIYDKIK